MPVVHGVLHECTQDTVQRVVTREQSPTEGTQASTDTQPSSTTATASQASTVVNSEGTGAASSPSSAETPQTGTRRAGTAAGPGQRASQNTVEADNSDQAGATVEQSVHDSHTEPITRNKPNRRDSTSCLSSLLVSGRHRQSPVTGMKCLSAIEQTMKQANERYVLLNKNTFQEIFDATLHEMTGAAAPLSRPLEVHLEPREAQDREAISLHSTGPGVHGRSKAWPPEECSGIFPANSAGNSSPNETDKSDLFRCQSVGDAGPTPTHKRNTSGMYAQISGEPHNNATLQGTNRGMTALSDITNDHLHTGVPGLRMMPSMTGGAVPPPPAGPLLAGGAPLSPADMDENEPLDLTTCGRRASVSATSHHSNNSLDGSSSRSTSPPASPATNDLDPVSSSSLRSNPSGYNHSKDMDSDSDLSGSEEIDPLGLEDTESDNNLSEKSREPNVSKHSYSDVAGRKALHEPGSCLPRGLAAKESRSGAGNSNSQSADPATSASQPLDSRLAKQRHLGRTRESMTGGSGSTSVSNMKPRGTENWAALSKATVYDLVEEMVARMDEEQRDTPVSSPRSHSSEDNSNNSDNSMEPQSRSGHGQKVGKDIDNLPSTSSSTVSSVHSVGRPARYSSPHSEAVIQSYNQSLSPLASPQQTPLTTSQHSSPKSTGRAQPYNQHHHPSVQHQYHSPGMTRPGSRGGDRGLPEQDSSNSGQSPAAKPGVKQCWVALNKMVVFDIVEDAIRSEAKEDNNNVTYNCEHNSTSPRAPISSSTAKSQLSDNDRSRSPNEESFSGNGNDKDALRKRKCDSPISNSSSKTKCVDRTPSKSASSNIESLLCYEPVNINDSCKAPKRPRSSESAPTDPHAFAKQPRRKSADMEDALHQQRYDISAFSRKLSSKSGQSDQAGFNKESLAVMRRSDLHVMRYSPSAHGPLGNLLPLTQTTAGHSTTLTSSRGHRSNEGAKSGTRGKQGQARPPSRGSSSSKTSSSRSTPIGSPVHDLVYNTSSTHLGQSQITPIDYGSKDFFAAKQENLRRLHSMNPSIRSQCSLPENNQYALGDTSQNRSPDSSCKKRPFNKDSDRLTSANMSCGLDSSQALTLSSPMSSGGDGKDARSSPRLGWIAVSKADVHSLFDSVVDSMMAAEDPDPSGSDASSSESGKKSKSQGISAGSPCSVTSSGDALGRNNKDIQNGQEGDSKSRTSPLPTMTRPSSRDVTSSSAGSPAGSLPAGSPAPVSRTPTPASPASRPSPSGCPQTSARSPSSEILDEHIIVDPGSPDSQGDGDGKDGRSNKAFKWKSSLLMRVHEETQGPSNVTQGPSNVTQAPNNGSPIKGQVDRKHHKANEKEPTGSEKSGKGSGLHRDESQSRQHTTGRSSRRSGKKR